MAGEGSADGDVYGDRQLVLGVCVSFGITQHHLTEHNVVSMFFSHLNTFIFCVDATLSLAGLKDDECT